MCGLVGSLVLDGSDFRVEPEWLARMRDVMAHRGPDGSGVWVDTDGRVGLGHRRLAILDLTEAASQPMRTEDGALTLVFNGEIYNHAAIRAELIAAGHTRWTTDHSDTEVILRAFAAWGIDCIERFRGMFAFALWDARSRELWLVRDRIGIKPLYWAVHHGRLVFGSEIKALLEDKELPRAVDEEALFHYLSFLTTPAPQTLFQGVHKLAGGTWMRVRPDGRIDERRWWDALERARPMPGADDETIAAAVLDELRTAVQLRKESDVPVGVFLSGGIDSSTNAALFQQGETRPVRTFTIGYKGDNPSSPNEVEWARRLAKHVGAEHHELLLDVDDLVSFLPRMAWLQDEPIADPVCVPLYYVSKLARDAGVIVTQVGEGADELFWGYSGWKRSLEAQLLLDRLPRLPGTRGLVSALRHVPRVRDNWRLEWLDRTARGLPIFWGGAEAYMEHDKRALLHPRLRERFAGLSSWDALAPIRARYEAHAWERHPLHWMTYLDLNLRLPELLLMRVDKMSMGVSLEGRVPFLDHKFVELAMGIPAAAKTRNGTLKHILKKAVRGVIPDDFIDRKKQGFGVPVHEWTLGRLGDVARQRIDAFCANTELLDRDAVRAFTAARGGADVWRLLNLALWHRIYIEGADPTTL